MPEIGYIILLEIFNFNILGFIFLLILVFLITGLLCWMIKEFKFCYKSLRSLIFCWKNLKRLIKKEKENEQRTSSNG